MSNLTLNAAKAHLNGLSKLAVAENQFLSCVHTYLRNVDIDVAYAVRADTLSSHNDIRDLLSLQATVSEQVDKFLRGAL